MCGIGGFGGTGRRLQTAGNDRDPRFGHAAPGLGLVTHCLDGLRAGADEHETGLLHGGGK